MPLHYSVSILRAGDTPGRAFSVSLLSAAFPTKPMAQRSKNSFFSCYVRAEIGDPADGSCCWLSLIAAAVVISS